ncbi:hypothetical protein TNCV_2789601 [Trichonephila clavipes]|nr:hypothetical protein TNCV_2789601 [Trichonephila clavipes]
MNESDGVKRKLICEVNKNSVFSNVRLEKLPEHRGKKDTSAIGNYILVDFNQVNNLLRGAKCQYCEKQTLKLELGANFFKCTPGKIEHCGKKDTSAIGNYILVDFNQVNNLLRSAKCQYCEKQTLKLELGAKLGFSYNLKLLCSNCDENKTVVNTSLKSVQTSHDVNLRITQAFSHIGKGYSAIEKFCMVMNIDPFSSTTYGKCETAG